MIGLIKVFKELIFAWIESIMVDAALYLLENSKKFK